MVVIIISVVVFGLLALLAIAGPNRDTTTVEEIASLSAALAQAIHEAEETVGKHAPHDSKCRDLLWQARRCLSYSGATERLVVTKWMIKQKRIEGIRLANEASQLALASRKYS